MSVVLGLVAAAAAAAAAERGCDSRSHTTVLDFYHRDDIGVDGAQHAPNVVDMGVRGQRGARAVAVVP